MIASRPYSLSIHVGVPGDQPSFPTSEGLTCSFDRFPDALTEDTFAEPGPGDVLECSRELVLGCEVVLMPLLALIRGGFPGVRLHSRDRNLRRSADRSADRHR